MNNVSEVVMHSFSYLPAHMMHYSPQTCYLSSALIESSRSIFFISCMCSSNSRLWRHAWSGVVQGSSPTVVWTLACVLYLVDLIFIFIWMLLLLYPVLLLVLVLNIVVVAWCSSSACIDHTLVMLLILNVIDVVLNVIAWCVLCILSLSRFR